MSGDVGAEEGYEDRLVAFIDILGFADLIKGSRGDQAVLNTVRAALNEVARARAEWSAFVLKRNGQDMPLALRSHAFSDSIIISDLAAQGALPLFRAIAEICFALFKHGSLTRGAVSRGPLYHDSTSAFGTSLINAYELEQKVSHSPRILLTDGVHLACNLEFVFPGAGGQFMVRELCLRDADGLEYLDWLSLLLRHPEMFFLATDARGLVVDGLRSGIAQVCTRIQSETRYGVRAKQGWFVRYFNRTVAQYDYARELVVEPIPRPALIRNEEIGSSGS